MYNYVTLFKLVRSKLSSVYVPFILNGKSAMKLSRM